jgi:hypothetical protein
VDVSSVPVTGDLNVFSTQLEFPPFGIGSGVPKRQPVVVQSKVAPGVGVAPTVHEGPLHESVKRFVAPSGVVLSGTVETPPPRESRPQRIVFKGVTPFVSRKVCPHVPVATVDRKSNAFGTIPVVDVVVATGVDVVDEDVELLLDVLVVGTGADVDDEVLELEELVVCVVVVGRSEELDVELVVGGVVVGTGAELVVLDEEVVVLARSVEELEVVTVVVEVVEVVGPTHWHVAEQVCPAGHGNPPPVESNAPAGDDGGSHCSPGSSLPLPQTAGVVEVVVLVLTCVELLDVVPCSDVELLDVVACIVVVVVTVVVVGGCVLVVVGVEPAQAPVSVTRSVFTSRAKKAPVRVAPCVSSSVFVGAQIVPSTFA